MQFNVICFEEGHEGSMEYHLGHASITVFLVSDAMVGRQTYCWRDVTQGFQTGTGGFRSLWTAALRFGT